MIGKKGTNKLRIRNSLCRVVPTGLNIPNKYGQHSCIPAKEQELKNQ